MQGNALEEKFKKPLSGKKSHNLQQHGKTEYSEL